MELKEFFRQCPRVALGFSGGVDSAYLLYAALEHGAQVKPYFVKTAFQPRFELEDARRLCAQLGVELTVLELDVLAVPCVAENPPDRCYHCKRALFGRLRRQALADGYTVLIDGTNASDDAGDRPGMRALGELSVRSPLRECGITKAQVRALGGAVHLGQARLRLPGHPGAHRGGHRPRDAAKGRGRRGGAVLPGLQRFAGAGVPRRGPAAAVGATAGTGRQRAGEDFAGPGPLV